MLVLLDIESTADRGGEGVVSIVEGVGAERQWEHSDVLEVDHPDAIVCVNEEVVLLDVGVVYRTRHRLETEGWWARLWGAQYGLKKGL